MMRRKKITLRAEENSASEHLRGRTQIIRQNELSAFVRGTESLERVRVVCTPQETNN